MSIGLQGFQFAVANNVYHVPIVLKLFDRPEFLTDAFYQSLRNFTSYVWPALSLVSTEANIATVFLVSHFISRFALYAAVLAAVRELGLRSLWSQLAVVAVLAATSLFAGHSLVGATPLQMSYFTHSGLALPLQIACLLLAARGQWVLAAAANGITFNINAFTALWMGGPLAALAGRRWLTGSLPAARLAAAALVHAALAAPLLFWIWTTIRDSVPYPAFDYLQFIRYYYPKHFIIDASPARDVLGLGAMVLAGALAAGRLRTRRSEWNLAYYSLVAVLGAGMALPYVTSSRLALNMCVLRVDGLITLLALLFVMTVALAELESAGSRRAEALAALGSLVIGQWPLAAVAMCLLRRPDVPSRSRALAIGLAAAAAAVLFLPTLLGTAIWGSGASVGARALLAAACGAAAVIASSPAALLFGIAAVTPANGLPFVLAALALVAWLLTGSRRLPGGALFARNKAFASLALAAILGALAASGIAYRLRSRLERPANHADIAWRDLQKWARLHTPPGSEFLVPLDITARPFQLESGRRAWTDFRQGAAVMWSPAFYQQWFTRYDAVRRLRTADEILRYCASNRISYCIIDLQASGGAPGQAPAAPLFVNARYSVYRTGNPQVPGKPGENKGKQADLERE